MSRLKTHFEFMAGMHIEGELYFNRYSLTLDFYTLNGTPSDQNIAMDRISYFIYDTVSRSIFIQEDNVVKIKQLTKAGLPVLTVPDPGPFDPVVLAVIATKLNAICEDVLVITEAEIISEVSGALSYIWDTADDDDEIHGMVNAADESKWWASKDPRFGSYPAETDVAAVEEIQPFPLTWDMLELAFDGEISEEDSTFIVDVITQASGKKNGTVIKADFHPTNKKPPKKKK